MGMLAPQLLSSSMLAALALPFPSTIARNRPCCIQVCLQHNCATLQQYACSIGPRPEAAAPSHSCLQTGRATADPSMLASLAPLPSQVSLQQQPSNSLPSMLAAQVVQWTTGNLPQPPVSLLCNQQQTIVSSLITRQGKLLYTL